MAQRTHELLGVPRILLLAMWGLLFMGLLRLEERPLWWSGGLALGVLRSGFMRHTSGQWLHSIVVAAMLVALGWLRFGFGEFSQAPKWVWVTILPVALLIEGGFYFKKKLGAV